MRIDAVNSFAMDSTYVGFSIALDAIFLALLVYILVRRRRLGSVVCKLPTPRVTYLMMFLIGLAFLIQCFLAFRMPDMFHFVTVSYMAFWLAFTAIGGLRSIRSGGLVLDTTSAIAWKDVATWDWEWNPQQSNWTLLVRTRPGKTKKCEHIDGEPKDRIEQALRAACGAQ